ncbi:expressed unknown protein [Seminavis robusta]|uniref:Uncharacterized protein n=1 Tax=Seminavis robusta TaxID=568900 RepID=A0A9N8EC42_9STRA|nr:expressed unknown protein [Seminavis robusta]|eukprot:Sro953_g224230.1 n/a (122) ;mRNA; f:30545-30910
MMQYYRQIILFLLLVVFQSTQAFHEEPSESVRRHLATISEEDVIVMQAEMAWGAQEMKRYKTLRGDWPVRSSLAGPGDSNNKAQQQPLDNGDSTLFRGGSSQQQESGEPHHDYWNYLVSMF